jgi:DNA-binding NarL/FixJ family response regulator
MMREGLAALLEKAGFSPVGEASDGIEAVELTRRHEPDVAVLDAAMPRLNGIDAAREIGRLSPQTKTVLLTMHSEDHYVLEALHAGVKGYVVKSHSAGDLARAIDRVVKGGIYLSPGLSETLIQGFAHHGSTPGNTLSPRERHVLQLVAEGHSTKQIAALLGVSAKTIESHRTRIMQKLEIHDTVRLVHYAIRSGLLHV